MSNMYIVLCEYTKDIAISNICFAILPLLKS
jgi:hypothetical protein